MADQNIPEKDQDGKLGDDIFEEEFDLDEILENRGEKAKKPSIWAISGLILAVLLAFGLGRLSKIESQKEPIMIEYGESFPETPSGTVLGSEIEAEKGEFVGSKNGTKFHYPWCSGAKRIKDENKIWFSSRADAEDRGYSPAANCPGL